MKETQLIEEDIRKEIRNCRKTKTLKKFEYGLKN